jgi:lon-related putative ATP-dependent protease
MSAKSLKPDPIPLQVQIVLIGSPWLYHLLYRWDEDFKELFRVKAEFDTSMEYSVENSKDFASVIFKIEKEQGLMPLNHDAVGRMLEESCRMADDQHRISIRFGELSKILREADHYARREGFDEIDNSHIDKAIESKYFRSNLIQEKINDLIRRNTLMIDLQDSKIGQINGISVIDLGDISFGRPNKITVSVASGKQGLIDIEREVKLGGPLHSKGVLILNGYLNEHYGQDKQISLMASLVFEQSYSEIEGDSASSAELYAILSSLSKTPLKQGVAVTGSVNQKGEVQPIGAVNEKIEGYFEVCRQHGLTGEQGVVIPKSNMDNLMLKPELVSAVKEGRFHIWAVETIDQGLEILTGNKAGKKLKQGGFSKNSVHDRVDRRIRALNQNLSPKPRKKG